MSKIFKIKILKPGMFSTIQDLGRNGYQDSGIPFGGAMDKEAHKIANELLDNPHETPTIEMTMIGAEFEFEGQGQIAITGADMEAELNGASAPLYETIDIKEGDQLHFGRAKLGCRAYLAAKGEWKVPKWLGSASVISNLLHMKDLPQPLKKDQSIEVNTHAFIPIRKYALSSIPVYSSCYIIRVITGPEFDQFNIEQVQSFFQQTFEVSPDSNRMGYRLKGSLKDYQPERDEISSGVVEGTIQITHSGQPIILTADAQTTGGYPRIAHVIAEDLSIIAQMKAGEEVKFMLVSLSDL